MSNEEPSTNTVNNNGSEEEHDEFNLIFQTDVSSAIQTSLVQQKPLLMIIKDTTEHSIDWISDHFNGSKLNKFTQ